ncbi:hypothetical protein WM23_07620 [Burkholderia ubonensis]|nr:hypothetical protein WM23_07620 [Burkholderia ubonensis]
MQQRCSVWFHQRLHAQLTDLFRQCARSSPGSITLERLTIDVGTVSLAAFETQLSERVLRQLAQQLSRLVEAAPGAPAARVVETGGVAWPAASELPDAPRDATADPVTLFEHYLATGYFARPQWWRGPQGPEAWLIQQCQDAPAVWRPVLARADAQPGPRQRLAQLLSAPAQRTLQARLATAAAGVETPTRALPEDAPAIQFERDLHSGIATNPPGWQDDADRWLLAQWHAQPAAWRPVLARCCVQQRTLARLRQWLKPATLRILSHWLTPDDPPLPLPASPAPPWHLYLPLAALRFFEQHPEQRVPDADPMLTADAVEPELVPWLERLRAPDSPILRQWLRPLYRTPALRAQLHRDWPAALVSTLQAALEARPAAPRLPARPAAPASEPLAVSNAGLVLLWPLLPSLFTELGLLEHTAFVDPEARLKAVCWLDALIWADEAEAEWRTPLNKFLCGLPLDEPLIPWQAPQQAQQAVIDTWLGMLGAQLCGAADLSASDIRALFLQRPGALIEQRSRWTLRVEQEATDMLLSELPWPMEQVILPWLDAPLAVQWL